MHKKKIAAVTMAAIISNFSASTVSVLAHEISNQTLTLENKSNEESNQASISKFDLYNNNKLNAYNKVFKMDNSNISSISNNGGNYGSSTIDKSIDGNLNTHWETGKPNNANFTNEVIFELNEITNLNRIVYAARQSSAKGKGFAQEVEIYSSLTNEGDDFRLVTSGEYKGSTGDIVEIKFNSTEFKRIKFKFKKANQDWASASEFMFYREDSIIDKMYNIFTNEQKNQISEEFNTLEKLDKFEAEAKSHPLYEDIKEDIDNARILLESKNLEYVDAKVSKFLSINDDRLAKYDEDFKIKRENITSITTNGGQYAHNSIDRAIDGDANTQWHSGRTNSSDFTNEVVITLDKLTTIDRITYLNKVSRGFAKSFDIYASKTSSGDTFEKISSGSQSVTSDNLEIKFKPTELRRVKFVFKEGHENWAIAYEFGLYKEDTIKEKMDRLFISSDMNEVSPEFSTTQAIENLIEEVKGHALEEEYQEKLNIAKDLVEFGKVESGTANIKKFNPFYSEYINAYDEKYRVPSSNISKIENNGGNYSGSPIKYAIDEDVNTHWETGKPNSSSFKNEVILTLDEAQVINRLTYKSRNGGKGFAEQFSIYVSPVSSGNSFQKVSEGRYTTTNDMLEIKFDKIKAKRVKFVFDKANQDWASIGDLRLYKEDLASEKVDRLFTSIAMDTVSEEFNSIEKLNDLENEVKNHPLYQLFKQDIDDAKEIVEGKFQNIKTVVAEQHGDRNAHTSKNLKFGFGNNNQPTGVVARPGETVTVYVDVEDGKPLPQLMFSQQEGSFANWGRTVSLHPGKNVITVPKVTQDDGWYKHSVTPGGPVYIVNPYTKEQQGKAPTIRFAKGVENFPTVDKNTSEEEFIEFLKDYKKKVDEDIKNNPNVMDRKVIDTFELVTDHMVVTGTASGAYDAYINRGFKPLDSVTMYNDHMDMLFKYQGIDGRSEKHDIKYTRENIRLAQPFGYMYAAGGHIGVQRDVMSSILTSVGDWGVDHEMGHKMDIGVRTVGEVTNNMLPQQSSYYYNKPNKRIPFESHTFKNVMATDNNKFYDGGFFEKLAAYWQLEMIYPGYWGKLNSLYRENNVVLESGNENNDKLNKQVYYSSIALELDLTEFFERHGFWVSDETKQFVSKYQKPDKKIWYANYDYIEYKGEGFTKEPTTKVITSKDGENIKVSFDVDKDSKEHVMGYEVYRNGKLVAFTSTNTFVDRESNFEENITYKIVPFDKRLNEAKGTEIKSHTPTIKLQQNEINTKLNKEFNPMDLVKAYNYNGEEITSKIVINGDIDTTQRGSYKVEYIVSDQDITTKEILNVNVVSDYDYLSDSEWTSVTTQHGTPRRISNIKGRVNGDIKTFDKGFGIHANGKITYDLSDKDYDNFEALLGVDMGIQSNNNSSITFKIVGDGKTIATTSVIKHADDMVAINVPVSGVNELVIEVHDGGNGNTLDHSVIANPKLTTNNAKPVINADNKVYKLGEKVNLMDGVTAIDAEDGDITSNIEIVSNNYEEGKTGRFEVTYRVTDSDGNTTEKKCYITIHEDFEVKKSKYGQFNNISEYNEEFKIPVVAISNNGGNYGSSVIGRVIDNNINTHWETGKPNSGSFTNEVIFDLGENQDIDKMAYAARRDAGGKGFANKFEIYVSNEAQGNDFVFAGKGEYKGSSTDVVEFKISKSDVRRVKFKFVEAKDGWASLSEVAFYKADALSDKINNDLFTDANKTEVTENYNTLEKLEALREEVKNHTAFNLFGADLNKAKEIIIAKFPTLKVEKTTFVKLNSEFDLMSGVVANDQEDGDLISKVQVNSNGFTTSKTGEYTLTYTVTDSDENTITKTRKVIVYSENTYISDMNWEKAVSGWRDVTKDTAVASSNKIKLNVDGTVKEFDKGIGAATNAEIVYNLDGDYTHFTTYVGTDKNYDHNSTSIIFKIFADGKEVYTSDVIRKDSKAKFISLDVTGVKELKLVANDAGDGGLGDFASWADTKVYTTNSKPKLTIPKSLSTKVGQEIDLDQEYSAIDAEDGDITSKVEVSGKVNFNRAGKYPITYTVTDSDGNKVVKTRTIAVVNMDDYKYLTEYNWKSTQNSYTAPIKDKSVSGRALRLTNENGQEVTYERGIGAHSTSTIIYDLSDKDYAYFTSYVGVDRQMFGTVASVSFEVYVDGKKKFDSGLMNSRDPQKFVEVDINDAKELKLVVTDGGNGIGSDHASWGDTKLHFANTELDFTELNEVIEKAEAINKEEYTTTSIKILNEAIDKAKKVIDSNEATQELIDEVTKELNDKINNLVALDEYKGLEKLLQEAKELDIYMYTKNSILALESSIIKAETILDDKSLTIEELKKFTEEFRETLDSMQLDSTKLEIKESLEKVKDITREDVVGEKHAEARWESFQIAKNDLERLLIDINTTKEKASSAIFMLNYTVEELFGSWYK